MDGLRAEQGKFKADRSKTFDEMKRLQENVQKKIKEAQAQRGKVAFRSVGEIDDRIEWVGFSYSSFLRRPHPPLTMLLSPPVTLQDIRYTHSFLMIYVFLGEQSSLRFPSFVQCPARLSSR
jgi:hypothetical protein